MMDLVKINDRVGIRTGKLAGKVGHVVDMNPDQTRFCVRYRTRFENGAYLTEDRWFLEDDLHVYDGTRLFVIVQTLNGVPYVPPMRVGA